MSSEHEQIQEALAAQALHAVDPAEASRLEKMVEGHLPTCPECREVLDRFQATAGDLALAASFRRPPRLLKTRLRRAVRSRRTGRLRWLPVAAAGVLVAVVAGLGAWNAHLTSRVTQAEQRRARTTEVLATVSHPQSHVVTLSANTASSQTAVKLAAAYVPGRPALYLFGSMPEPTEGRVYQVWLVRGARFDSAGTFTPERGTVLLRIDADPNGYESVLITVEPGRGSDRPSAQRVVQASL